MSKYNLTIYSYDEVEPISLEEVKGGAFLGFCCIVNSACNKNKPTPDDDKEELKTSEKLEKLSKL